MKKLTPSATTQNDTTKIDVKSRLGYYAEYVVAYVLAKIIYENGGKLSDRSDLNKLKASMYTRRRNLISLKVQSGEIDRQETGGKSIAIQIYKDLNLKADFNSLLFDIALTGDSGKGVDKADVVLTVTMPSTKQTIDRIAASIKTYKTANINLANSTFTSLLKALSGNSNYENSALSKFEGIIFSAMVDKYMEIEKISDRKLAESIVGSGEKFLTQFGKSKFDKLKVAGRVAAKASHKKVSIKIISEFNSLYMKNKKNMNKNLLHLIGMDGEDDFYAAIGDADKQKVLSSRQSPEMKRFLESIKTDKLNISMAPSKSGNSIDVSVLIDKKIVAKSSISFTDTGIGSTGMTKSKGTGKTNFWFNVKAFM